MRGAFEDCDAGGGLVLVALGVLQEGKGDLEGGEGATAGVEVLVVW